jgi:hypothetical protein
MRNLALWSVGALLLGASATGCYDEPEQPAAHSQAAVVSRPAAQPQGGSVTVVHHGDDRGVASTQAPSRQGAAQAQPNTPVINNFVTPPPPAAQPSATAPLDSPAAQPADDRARASQIVAEATQQIDRLTRVLSMSANDSRHADIEAAVARLQSRRERVLQDMKTIETTGASSSDDTQHIMLNRDVSDLQTALRDSDQYAPQSAQ